MRVKMFLGDFYAHDSVGAVRGGDGSMHHFYLVASQGQ